MSLNLTTFSAFFYGHEVDDTNNLLDFSEGGPELTAELNIGSYSLTDFVTEVERALNAAGSNAYSVSLNRTTRFITISTTVNFSLLVSSGSHVGRSPWSLIGFSGADRTSASTYTGTLPSGSKYSPQYKLQEYVPSSRYKTAIEATVNKTASGKIEVVKYGNESFIQMNIKYATNIPQDGSVIKTNPTGVEDLEAFMDYIIEKGPFEFIPDINSPNNFEIIRVESIPEYKDGTGYKLKELYDKNLPGYFETGTLKMRVET